MDELTKVRVNNLISLRQSLLVLLPVLIGGTVGMVFVNGHALLRIMLIILGVFFTGVMIFSLCKTITELNRCIYGYNRRNNEYK